ncbi:HAD hydrolase family protein [Clostridium sp. D43t1_170807_H7]|uniref:HAD hydrolase family protein n=1 Tax=Clostridium sp. D43t1_170807_H7 TaxID=2787140 RepID=UPI001896EDC7|nr:HAD hydrolase family protein [Clostridium sp. D43t1_170807_H7]MBQ9011992.1 HAD hydrolase family protein [Bacilli bacterium]MEE0932898.1 HAD hydrolase family protein [Clostridium sp.]
MKIKSTALPPIGMRIIKSSIGVLLGFIIYLLRGKQGAPFYTALSVLWCMQPYPSNAKANARQRTIGTMIGAFYGLIMILLEYYFLPFDNEFIRYLIISVLIIPVIYTTVVINKKNASYFSCVVFLSIVVNHLNDKNPYFFVFNRVLDTMIGIVLALIINTARIPRKKRDNLLFVSELDKALLNMHNTLTPYSKIELNKMLDDGLKFTIATMRTPAALLEALKDIRIKLPVIAMDGAILFDVKDNRYLKVYEMTHSETKEFLELFKENNLHCFVNVVVEDSVIIYYDDFKNEVEKKIYDTLRSSPYRNYIKEELPERYGAVYLMLIDENKKIENLYLQMKKLGYTKKFKILKYSSDDFPGYSYIKVYNKKAIKENMIQYIKELTKADDIIILESTEEGKNLRVNKNESNEIVRNLKRIYEPYFWK